MTFRYTDLNDDELGAYLAKIRRIASMPDADALSEVDELINVLGLRCDEMGSVDIDEDLFNDCDFEADELMEFEKDIKRNRKLLERGEAELWEAKLLLERAEDLGEDWDSAEKKKEMGTEIARLKDEASELASKIEAKWAENRICESQNDIIHSVSSIRKIQREMIKAQKTLKRVQGMTPELECLIRSSLERCAWYRAKKRLSAAAIEKEIGNEKKMTKLLAEARAFLREDWKTILGSEGCPDIDDAPE
jgi:hypothetical protein